MELILKEIPTAMELNLFFTLEIICLVFMSSFSVNPEDFQNREGRGFLVNHPTSQFNVQGELQHTVL